MMILIVRYNRKLKNVRKSKINVDKKHKMSITFMAGYTIDYASMLEEPQKPSNAFMEICCSLENFCW